MERPTFSPFWHRVRSLKPRLRPYVQITRQHYRGRRWHVAHDPGTNQFYRLSPVAYDLVSTLDGSRDVETAWKMSLTKFGDAAPTQGEVIELVAQLYNANLLHVDMTPETEQLLHRGRERFKRKALQQAIGLMYFRLKLFNPDRLLGWLEPMSRPFLNRWFFLVWCAFLGYVLYRVLPEWPTLVKHFDKYVTGLTPALFGWAIAIFALLKLWHELGHGLVCKRLGGAVPEAGVMLLILIPSPYVDASACWAFPNKWHRTAVGAAGMVFELGLAGVFALLWLGSADGSLTQMLSFYAMFTASVSTVIFNINPLMKFDGYYMLSDVIEVPNLMQRSQQMLQYLVQRFVFRLKNARSPSSQPTERVILVVYGVLAMIYRVFLFLTITLYIVGEMFVVGLLLAVWSVAMWFLLPAGKFLHWLASNSLLVDHRARTIGLSAVMAAGVIGLVGVMPLPDWRRGTGVIESEASAGVFFRTEGFVREVRVKPGQRVRAGEVMAVLESPLLRAELERVAAEIGEVTAARGIALEKDEPASVTVADARLRVLGEKLAEFQRRETELEVRAPIGGVVVGANPSQLVGAFVRRGDPLTELVEPEKVRVAATLPQTEAAWFHDAGVTYGVWMRTASQVHRAVEGARAWSPQAGVERLPHAALGPIGGGTIEVDPRDEQGRTARRPQFTVYIEPAGVGGPQLGAPGERVYVRFTLPSKPLAAQVWDRLSKVLQGRVNL